MFSGGGGLVSTASDYLRFCQMLLNGGERDGVRILRRDTVAQMTANSLPAGVRFAGAVGAFVGPAAGSSWGLGFAIRTDPHFSGVPGGLGSFGWGGIWGTTSWIDPVHDLIAVQMIQVEPAAAGAYARALRHLTYAALRVPDDDRHGAPAEPISASAETLAAFAGSYAFGPSLSSRDVREASAASAAVGMEIALEGGRRRSPRCSPAARPPRPASCSGTSSPTSMTCRSSG
jgi:CubicO group peptidase (beta-lactamase class C family)